MSPITIRDLAKELNLSITQVSRALGGYKDVSEATREKVVKAARELGYEASYAARQLRRKRSDAIGYILPASSPRFFDPFFTNFLAGLCDQAASMQFDLLVSSCPPGSDSEETIYQHWFQSGRVDGMVLNRVRVHDWRVEYLAENHVPFVALGRPESRWKHPAVIVKEREGFRRLVRYLDQKGHQRVAYIGGPEDLVVQRERFGGYCQGMADAGLDVDDRYIRSVDLTEEGGYLAAKDLLTLADPPTAILGCNDQIAIGALSAVKESGRIAGSDFAVAGYDGIRETAHTDPPLTTLAQPTYDIARTLVNLLVSFINHQSPPDPPQIELEPELILRASTGL